jgi:hypothetical protein
MPQSADISVPSDSLPPGLAVESGWDHCPHCGGEILERPLTKQQFADFFSNGPRWVEKLCAEGMPFIQVEGQKRFVLSRCLKWLALRAESRRAGRR